MKTVIEPYVVQSWQETVTQDEAISWLRRIKANLAFRIVAVLQLIDYLRTRKVQVVFSSAAWIYAISYGMIILWVVCLSCGPTIDSFCSTSSVVVGGVVVAASVCFEVVHEAR